jgi:hypothetical protein
VAEAMMSTPSEDKLLSLVTEIQSDIRQIKSDLQSLLTLMKRQQKPTPTSSTNIDITPEPVENSQSGSPEDVLRYLRKTRGEDDTDE